MNVSLAVFESELTSSALAISGGKHSLHRLLAPQELQAVTLRRSGTQFKRDLIWGLTCSGGLTALFAVLAVAGRLMLGPEFHPSGLSLTTLLIDYAGLGVVGGMLVGLGRPLTSSMPGIAFLGAVWGIFLGLLIRAAAIGWRSWGYFDLLMTVIYIMAGALFGISFRRGVLRGEARLRDASRQP